MSQADRLDEVRGGAEVEDRKQFNRADQISLRDVQVRTSNLGCDVDFSLELLRDSSHL